MSNTNEPENFHIFLTMSTEQMGAVGKAIIWFANQNGLAVEPMAYSRSDPEFYDKFSYDCRPYNDGSGWIRVNCKIHAKDRDSVNSDYKIQVFRPENGREADLFYDGLWHFIEQCYNKMMQDGISSIPQ